MVTIEDAQVAAALDAVAAVDGTPPAMLATMIVEDWLRQHRHRFLRAASALERLDDDLPLDLPDDGVTSPGGDTPETGKEGDAPSGEGQSGTSGPASPGAPPAHRCDVNGCNYVGKSPQALGGHKATAHRATKKKATKKATAKPAADLPCSQCDRTFASKQALSTHVTRTHGRQDDDYSPDNATFSSTVAAYTCAVCHSRVGVVRKTPGLGDICVPCAKAAA